MEEEFEFRQWDELLPDALGLIFRNLSLQEVLTVVPRVCKSWKKAVKGPYCWKEIDIEEWSKNCCPENLDRMLCLLIPRSCGSLRKLCVSGLSNKSSFKFIANNVKSLQTFRLPKCELSDSIVEHLAGTFSNITFMDLRQCLSLNNWKLLTCWFTLSVLEVLPKCKHFEMLDVRGCWNMKLDEKFVKKFHKLKVIGPLVVDYYDKNGWDNCSNYSGSSVYIPWDFMAGDIHDDFDDDEVSDGYREDEERLEDVEMWFYDDLNAVDAGYDWPQSP
ncbi:hypothetical protein CQW23_14031 [Capsicum baccatum]|uniref:F-box domain-containing protein n=1 Tax=Capsicum baccatum TaxID=33114 RepID=A0A2G2WI17_CAPBA|nr:hypothetical protein CQW23_14031 [Capsicum baccatum]